MFIRLETASGIPISRQIADQIRLQCASGALSPGDRLPSVRALARELAVNQNTILHVYERLTLEGLLEMRHGDGTYIAKKLPSAGIERLREALREDAERLARRADTLGLGPEDVWKMVESVFQKIKKKGRPKGGNQ